MPVAGDCGGRFAYRSLTAVGPNCYRRVALLCCDYRNGKHFSRQHSTIKETAMMARKAGTNTSSQRPAGIRLSARPQANESLDPMQLSLPALVRRCATESDHFCHNRPYDARFAQELFRRALVERDEIA